MIEDMIILRCILPFLRSNEIINFFSVNRFFNKNCRKMLTDDPIFKRTEAKKFHIKIFNKFAPRRIRNTCPLNKQKT